MLCLGSPTRNSFPGARRMSRQSAGSGARRAVGAQIEGDLGLQRIGVLELVDEDALEAPLGRVSDRRLVAQQVARPRQQVLKRRDPVRFALALTPSSTKSRSSAEHAGERRRAVGREHSADLVARFAQHLIGHPDRRAGRRAACPSARDCRSSCRASRAQPAPPALRLRSRGHQHAALAAGPR